MTLALCVNLPMTGHKNGFHVNPLNPVTDTKACILFHAVAWIPKYNLESMELSIFFFSLKPSPDTGRAVFFKLLFN